MFGIITRTELYLDPLRGEGRARNGRSTAEGLELGVHDLALIVDFDLFADRRGFFIFIIRDPPSAKKQSPAPIWSPCNT